MVDKDRLQKEENLKYDTEHRNFENGKAWGDDEDPEVLILKREKVKEEKKALMTSQKQQVISQGGKKVKKQRCKTQKSVKGKEKAQDPGSNSNKISFDDYNG